MKKNKTEYGITIELNGSDLERISICGKEVPLTFLKYFELSDDTSKTISSLILEYKAIDLKVKQKQKKDHKEEKTEKNTRKRLKPVTLVFPGTE